MGMTKENRWEGKERSSLAAGGAASGGERAAWSKIGGGNWLRGSVLGEMTVATRSFRRCGVDSGGPVLAWA